MKNDPSTLYRDSVSLYDVMNDPAHRTWSDIVVSCTVTEVL